MSPEPSRPAPPGPDPVSRGHASFVGALGHAGYATATTLISTPDLFSIASRRTRSFFAAALGLEGEIRDDGLLKEWGRVGRILFSTSDPDAQMEICAVICSVAHEWFHHFDLLATPFGATLHALLCEQYLAFRSGRSS